MHEVFPQRSSAVSSGDEWARETSSYICVNFCDFPRRAPFYPNMPIADIAALEPPTPVFRRGI